MRHALTALLLLLALGAEACSFPLDYVVINASDRPVEVTYRIEEVRADPLLAAGKPAVVAASRLKSQRDWQLLPPTQYAFDHEKREVTVSLGPGMALRVTEGGTWSEERTGEDFIIQGLSIRGARGEISLKGAQVYKSFVPVPKPRFTFGPETTLLTITYK